MLTILTLAVLALAVVFSVLFAALCLAIRREDRTPRLTTQPPTLGAAITRRIAGLSVRRPAPPVPDEELDPHLVLRAPPRTRGTNEGR